MVFCNIRASLAFESGEHSIYLNDETAPLFRGLAERCTKIAVINAAGLLIFIGALYLMHLDDYSRIVLALFYILGTAGVVIERMILRWVDRARRRKGLGLRHILLVGGGKSAALYLRALEHNPYYGFVVDGYLTGIE